MYEEVNDLMEGNGMKKSFRLCIRQNYIIKIKWEKKYKIFINRRYFLYKVLWARLFY